MTIELRPMIFLPTDGTWVLVFPPDAAGADIVRYVDTAVNGDNWLNVEDCSADPDFVLGCAGWCLLGPDLTRLVEMQRAAFKGAARK